MVPSFYALQRIQGMQLCSNLWGLHLEVYKFEKHALGNVIYKLCNEAFQWLLGEEGWGCEGRSFKNLNENASFKAMSAEKEI